jgi:hypothetical protein
VITVRRKTNITKKPTNQAVNLLPTNAPGIILGKVHDTLALSPTGIDYIYQ